VISDTACEMEMKNISALPKLRGQYGVGSLLGEIRT